MPKLLLCGLSVVFLATVLVSSAAEPPDDDQDPDPALDGKSYEKRLAWHRRTLINSYQAAGFTNSQWDGTVVEVLRKMAAVRARNQTSIPAGNDDAEVKAALETALKAGCDDPLIKYLAIRFDLPSKAKTFDELADQYVEAALALDQSGYGDWLRYYAHLRASQALSRAFYNPIIGLPPPRANQRDIARHRRWANESLVTVVRTGEAPIEEVCLASEELLEFLVRYGSYEPRFLGPLESAVVEAYPDEYQSWLLKGTFYKEFARLLGSLGTGKNLPDPLRTTFDERIKIADEAQRQAWKLNQTDWRTAVLGMQIAMNLGRGRDELEKWFGIAMTLSSSNLAACNAKMDYLDPKWNGSEKELLAFGHECVESRKWTGQVRLVLAKAHMRLAKSLPRSDRPKYWVRPGVWQGIKKSYDAYFAQNPTRRPSNAPFARYAFWCEQWDEFLKQVSLLPESYRNYFFGGKAELESMVRVARQSSEKTR